MDVFPGQGAVQRDHVGFAVQHVERYVFDVKLLRHGLVRIHVVSENPDAVPLQDFREDHADLAGPDDADGFAAQVGADEPVDRKVVFTHPVVGPVQRTVQRHVHGQRILGDRIGRVARHADDDQLAVGGRQVDVVVAGAAHGDHLNLLFGEHLDGFRPDIVVYEGADHVVAGGHAGRGRIQPRFEIGELETEFLIGRVE